ncbi:hypothetical protein ACWFMI_24825 [Nocardiopsis terrae]|uniref:hypothetical protein n=1 Tax=Streptomyces sp. NPDC057554 TaxID=3350538 RepID=UPI00369AA532
MTTIVKTCRKCGRTLPLSEYHRSGGWGHRARCKDCENTARRTPGAPARKDRPVPECGTSAAGRRHYKAGEKPCAPCARVLADEQAVRDAKRREEREAAPRLQPAA